MKFLSNKEKRVKLPIRKRNLKISNHELKQKLGSECWQEVPTFFKQETKTNNKYFIVDYWFLPGSFSFSHPLCYHIIISTTWAEM